jgi:DNA repair exonuclease SbcCD ATPase subunit
VESLSARVQRLNAENDDLLQRLGEAKRLKEQRERQFEEEKSQLTKRIRELEVLLKNGDESVGEMQEKMVNERKEHQVNQRVNKLFLKQTVRRARTR